MFELSIQTGFSGAHRLVDYPGDCARFHGHNWEVTVLFRGERLNELGICIDFREVKKRLGEVVAGLDHIDLNEHPAFQDINPTSETLAQYLYGVLRERFTDTEVAVYKVIVAESAGTAAAYFEV